MKNEKVVDIVIVLIAEPARSNEPIACNTIKSRAPRAPSAAFDVGWERTFGKAPSKQEMN